MDVLPTYRMFRDHMFNNSPGILDVANYWMSNKGRVKRLKYRKKK